MLMLAADRVLGIPSSTFWSLVIAFGGAAAVETAWSWHKLRRRRLAERDSNAARSTDHTP